MKNIHQANWPNVMAKRQKFQTGRIGAKPEKIRRYGKRMKRKWNENTRKTSDLERDEKVEKEEGRKRGTK